MKILATFILLFGFGYTAQAEAPADVDGWNKLKWGATEAEVVAAFPNAVPSDNPAANKCMRAIEPADVVGYQFRIVFIVECSTKKLIGVSMGPAGQKLSRIAAVGAMEKLYDELKLKYGPPTKSDRGSASTRFTWIFPSTQIELVLLASSADMTLLMLSYDQREKEDML